MITREPEERPKKGESNETKRELTKNNCSNLWKRTENITRNSVVLYLTRFTTNTMIFLKCFLLLRLMLKTQPHFQH